MNAALDTDSFFFPMSTPQEASLSGPKNRGDGEAFRSSLTELEAAGAALAGNAPEETSDDTGSFLPAWMTLSAAPETAPATSAETPAMDTLSVEPDTTQDEHAETDGTATADFTGLPAANGDIAIEEAPARQTETAASPDTDPVDIKSTDTPQADTLADTPTGTAETGQAIQATPLGILNAETGQDHAASGEVDLQGQTVSRDAIQRGSAAEVTPASADSSRAGDWAVPEPTAVSAEDAIKPAARSDSPAAGDTAALTSQASAPTLAAAAPATTPSLTSPTAPAPAPTQPMIVAAPAEVVSVITESLTADEPQDRVVVQLDPPELGRVSIDFKFDANGLQHITITGETPEALRQLRSMHFELIQALERQGLSGQDMTFRQQDSGGQNGSSGRAFSGPPAKEPNADTPQAAPARPAPPIQRITSLPGSPGGLNIRL